MGNDLRRLRREIQVLRLDVDRLEKNQRTPGTVEVCAKCGFDAVGMPEACPCKDYCYIKQVTNENPQAS